MVINGGMKGNISRWFNPGIWVWYSHCLKRSSINVKLGRVQIDNQLDEIEFPKRLVFSAKDNLDEGNLDLYSDTYVYKDTYNQDR